MILDKLFKITEPLERYYFLEENMDEIRREHNELLNAKRLHSATKRFVESGSHGVQRQIAKSVGLSEGCFSKYLAGRVSLSVPTARRLAAVIDPTIRF